MPKRQEVGSKRKSVRKPYQKPEIVKIRLEATEVALGCSMAPGNDVCEANPPTELTP